MTKGKSPRESIEEQQSSLEKNLKNDFYLSVLGNNTARNESSQYGEQVKRIAEAQHSDTMYGEDANKTRKEFYEKELESRKESGVADMPEGPSNYQLTKYVLNIIDESIGNLPVGKLESIVGEVSGAKIEVPEELKKYEEMKMETTLDAIEAGKEGKDLKQAVGAVVDDESEKAIYAYSQIMRQAIKAGAVYKLADAHRYDEINSTAEKIANTYRKAKGIDTGLSDSA